eukprot:COSAG02_NODE_1083_length_14694_cov_6.194519_14_plen_336_part_00
MSGSVLAVMIRGGPASAHYGDVPHATGGLSSSARVVPNLLTELTRVREDVAAVHMPDEGMRGTAADERKLRASLDGELHAKLALALTMAGEYVPAGSRADVQVLVEVAARVIRSISITPGAAERVAKRVAGGCVVALRARCGLRWLLAAMVRLAQHTEAHPALLRAGAVPAVVAAWAPSCPGEVLPLGAFDSTPRTARLDLVGYILLSFLSESKAAAHAVAMVPAQAVPHLVRALDERLALAPVRTALCHLNPCCCFCAHYCFVLLTAAAWNFCRVHVGASRSRGAGCTRSLFRLAALLPPSVHRSSTGESRKAKRPALCRLLGHKSPSHPAETT